ncbi:MAG: hypothetical protein PHX09_00315 [Clostridia bacterium]|nr:hypothetical protein [Clostridia bacterium]MDD4685694.1 hypothetical protein [Clostridia bacterium]
MKNKNINNNQLFEYDVIKILDALTDKVSNPFNYRLMKNSVEGHSPEIIDFMIVVERARQNVKSRLYTISNVSKTKHHLPKKNDKSR